MLAQINKDKYWMSGVFMSPAAAFLLIIVVSLPSAFSAMFSALKYKSPAIAEPLTL